MIVMSIVIMHHVEIDDYVLDVLLPDLAGHDRSPAAFLVYVVLWAKLYRSEERCIAVSLLQLGELAGLSKSAVQGAIRLLKRRGLVRITKVSATAVPQYELIRHWVRRRARNARTV
jgi:DNA-binding MarR family transcriptional regulator